MKIPPEEQAKLLARLELEPSQLILNRLPVLMATWTVALRQKSEGPRGEPIVHSIFVRESSPDQQLSVRVADARSSREAGEVLFWWLEQNDLRTMPRLEGFPGVRVGYRTAESHEPLNLFVLANLAIIVGSTRLSHGATRKEALALARRQGWPVGAPGGLRPLTLSLDPSRPRHNEPAQVIATPAPDPSNDLRFRARGGQLRVDTEGTAYVYPTATELNIQAFSNSQEKPVAHGATGITPVDPL